MHPGVIIAALTTIRSSLRWLQGRASILLQRLNQNGVDQRRSSRFRVEEWTDLGCLNQPCYTQINHLLVPHKTLYHNINCSWLHDTRWHHFWLFFSVFPWHHSFMYSSVLTITSLIPCSLTSYVSHSLTLFIHSLFQGFCHNVIVWMFLVFVRLFKAMLYMSRFSCLTGYSLWTGSWWFLSLLLDAWALLFLIISTFNMYRPLLCVCYSVISQLNKLTSAVWDYCLGKSSFMSFTANIGCFKPCDEMLKHR